MGLDQAFPTFKNGDPALLAFSARGAALLVDTGWCLRPEEEIFRKRRALASRRLPQVIRMILRLRCEIPNLELAPQPALFPLDLVASTAIT